MREVGMWHEARRQERRIRGLMVDYRKRAERRREYYERIKQDPAQFLRVYGRPCKIHWDSSVAFAAEGPNSMQPWQGDHEVKIDRFDARSSLDHIPEPKSTVVQMSESEASEERKCNYERYRVLVQNESTAVSEEQCLQQIYVDEQFGVIETMQTSIQKAKIEEDKKKSADKKAAIGYTYEDSTPVKPEENKEEEEEEEDDDDILSGDELDLDMAFDVTQLTEEQTRLLNACSEQYGMAEDDFTELLHRDKEEAEEIKLAKLMEEEKAQFSGRKSRRERRAYKEKRMLARAHSPPSYATRDSPKYEPYRRTSSSRSRSRSHTPEKRAEFITSFGGDSSDEGGGVVQGPALPPHLQPNADVSRLSRPSTSPKHKSSSEVKGGHLRISRRRRSSDSSSSRSRSRSRSSSRSRSKKNSRSRSRSRSRRSSYSSSRSRSRSRSKSRKRSRSSRSSSSSRSRSRSRRSHSKSSSRSRSRSRSNTSKSPSKSPMKSVQRYRRPSLSSSSMSISESDQEQSAKKSPTKSSTTPSGATGIGKAGAASKGKMSMQERMKRRMLAALNRQYKADKRARIEKQSKAEQERLDREEELRSMAIQMRRRERERRHQEQDSDSSDDSDDSAPRRREAREERDTKRRSEEHTRERDKERERSGRDRDGRDRDDRDREGRDRDGRDRDGRDRDGRDRDGRDRDGRDRDGRDRDGRDREGRDRDGRPRDEVRSRYPENHGPDHGLPGYARGPPRDHRDSPRDYRGPPRNYGPPGDHRGPPPWETRDRAPPSHHDMRGGPDGWGGDWNRGPPGDWGRDRGGDDWRGRGPPPHGDGWHRGPPGYDHGRPRDRDGHRGRPEPWGDSHGNHRRPDDRGPPRHMRNRSDGRRSDDRSRSPMSRPRLVDY